ncbi:MAG: Photosystem I assembly protein Ycf3 [Anaerolineae bacterium]|nr:Photosystem I assembly protein Ycf3 [Anaerolineae bacterium]
MSDFTPSQQIASGKNIAQAWGPNASANVTVYEFAPPAPVDAATLAAARRRLAEMPLDDIPEPANPPPGSRLPYTINPHFVGREGELRALARLLKANQALVTGQVVITGLGGVGKTQLAAAFAHHYGHYFAGGVHWLSLANPAAVHAEVVQCGLLMSLRPDFGQLKLDEQVPAVLAAWQSNVPRLLIFDNCEAEELLARWRPPVGGCRLLITSRRQPWSRTLAVQPLPLPPLPRARSIDLLLKFRPDLAATPQSPPLGGKPDTLPPGGGPDAAFNAIAAELGDLPLALHLAGSFLARYRRTVTPANYLAQVQNISPGGGDLLTHPSLIGRGAEWSPTGHELHVAKTFALSIEQLNPADAIDTLARQLLARAACFAPGEPIPTALLLSTVAVDDEAGDPPSAIRNSQFDLDDALRRLTELGLLTTADGQTVTLHRLLTDFIHQAVPDLAALPAVESTLLAKANQLNNAGDPRPLQAWQSHLRHVADTARKRTDEQAARLCSAVGYHLDLTGELGTVKPYYERALAINEQILGPQHPDTALCLNNLGFVLQELGELGPAKPYYERALAIREQELGSRHPDTALSLNNLGYLLQAMGDLEQAKPYYERALAIREQVLGPQHPHTAHSLNSMGYLLQAMGKLEQAKPYFERALAICEQKLGPQHPDTARSLNNLGALLKDMGELAAAKPYYERALAIWEQVFGPQHPDTASGLNNLGTLLDAMGEPVAAKLYYERALTIREQVLGPWHPDTANSLNNVGYVLQELGKLAAAKPYYERALAICEQVLGPQHLDTALSLNNLGTLLDAMGDLEQAKPYYERTLSIRERVLGSRHPDTALSLNNLGYLLQAMGDLEQAKPYYERALAIREQVLGPQHPDMALSLNNLGTLLLAMGEAEAAKPYFEQALAICEQKLGPQHPDTASSLRNLGVFNFYEGDYLTAAVLMRRALAIYEKALGSDHPDTRSTRQNLAIIEQRL